VFHCVLQSLYYNLVDMHKLTPNMQGVMSFPNWLSVKQNLQKLLSEICVVEAYLDPLNKYFPCSRIFQICKLVEQDIRNTLSFGSVV
jgi:hypothetical protein